jgi:hypothetical protein
MVISLEYPQKIVLCQVQLFLALALIVHESNTGEAGADDTERQNRCSTHPWMRRADRFTPICK